MFPPGSADPYVTGLVKHDGSGLSVTGGGTKVELKNFDVDPGTSMLMADVSANGKQVVQDAPIFFLDGSTLHRRTEGSTAVLEGTTVSLTKEAAELLNKTFKTDALTPFFKVGIAKVTVNTQ